jgi:16S rRNA G966 N2-methylase RsmD
VVFIEKNRAAAELIRANLDALGAGGRARVVQGSAALHLGGIDADVFFLDPPYPKEREYAAAMEALEGRREGLVIFQHSNRLELPEQFGEFARYRVLKQGDNALSFYRVPRQSEVG